MRNNNLVEAARHLTLHVVSEETRLLLEAVVIVQFVWSPILDLGETFLLLQILLLALSSLLFRVYLFLLLLLVRLLLLSVESGEHVLRAHVLGALKHELSAATSTASAFLLLFFLIIIFFIVIAFLVGHVVMEALLKLMAVLLLLNLQVIDLEQL